MQFSVLIGVTGHRLDRNPCDLTLSDVVELCQHIKPNHGESWHADDEPSGFGDSDLTYVAGDSGKAPAEFWANAMNMAHTNGDDDLVQRIFERMEGRYGQSAWWATTSSYQAMGILDRPRWEWLAERLGLTAEGTETMGTLGGPLSIGVVPDIVYEGDSNLVILTVRVTPILDVKPKPGRWERVKSAIVALHGQYDYPRASLNP